MDYKTLTFEDIEVLQSEINHYYKMRKLFLGLGFACIGTGIILIPTFVAFGTTAASYIAALFITAGQRLELVIIVPPDILAVPLLF